MIAIVFAMLLQATAPPSASVVEPTHGPTFAPAPGVAPPYREGKAMVRCQLETDGRLTDCTVLSETPGNSKVGAVALKLVASLRMKPYLRDREPVRSLVTIPIVLRVIGADASPSPAAAPSPSPP